MKHYEKLPRVTVPFGDHGHYFHRYSLVSWQVLEAEEYWRRRRLELIRAEN